MLFAALLVVHLLAAAFWIGGMALMQFVVRPVVADQIGAPPQRVALMAALMQRFLGGVVLAIVALWASGFAMIGLSGGFAVQPWGVNAMAAIALLMTLVAALIRLRLLPRLQRAVAAGATPAGAALLATVRLAVSLNLGLGVGLIAIALAGRAG